MLKVVLYWIHFFLVLLTILSVLRARKSPESTLAWILALIAIPVGGLIAYVLVGIDWRKRRLVARIPEEEFSAYLSESLREQQVLEDRLLHSDDPKIRRAARTIRLLNRTAAAPVTGGNAIDLFYDGDSKFDALLKDIAAARDSIHMEYYIWRSDDLGDRVLAALAERAAQGVTVRLIFDGWGSFGRISYAYRRALRKAGITYAFFLDLSNPLARLKINYRNHRKIAVIDGRVAYVGGMNVGEEYITGGRRFSRWRDTHLRIVGPAVSMLQAVFLVDWHNSGRELLLEKALFPETSGGSLDTGVPVQIAISGPDSPWEGIRLHYLELLNGARNEVLIQTPYYIPGDAIEQAMIAAALRGVRVVLMTVGRPDKRIPFWAALTYFPRLLEAGVEIYRYQPGFLHAKMMIQDRIVASVGTCNMDLRSFHLDYEVNAVLYSPRIADELAEQFRNDLDRCLRITLDDLDSQSAAARFRNAAVRLLSPLM